MISDGDLDFLGTASPEHFSSFGFQPQMGEEHFELLSVAEEKQLFHPYPISVASRCGNCDNNT